MEEARQKGGSLKLLNCDNRLCVQIRSESLDLRGQLPSDTGEITGEQHLANGVIEDHRRATAAAEAATATAREATAAAEAATASAVQRLADFRDADRHNAVSCRG